MTVKNVGEAFEKIEVGKELSKREKFIACIDNNLPEGQKELEIDAYDNNLREIEEGCHYEVGGKVYKNYEAYAASHPERVSEKKKKSK